MSQSRTGPTEADPEQLDSASVAWLIAPIAFALALAAVLLLGAPLGRLLFPVKTVEFWPSTRAVVLPEPTEQARFLIGLAGAVLTPLAVICAARWSFPRLPFARWAALLVQVALVVVLACAVLCAPFVAHVTLSGAAYFTPTVLIVAVVIALALAVVVSSPPALTFAHRLASLDSRSIRWGAGVVAIGATVIWLLPAIQLDWTIGNAPIATSYALQYTFDEGLSVVNGHAPLVNYSAQYGSLWPYVIALPLKVAGASLGVYTTLMVGITGLAMAAGYGVLRRVARSTLGTLALFLPFMATSFFILEGTPTARYGFADYFGVFPLRYAGPYFVAWLLARHLAGEQPRRPVILFVVAGLALLNNGDFGVPALGATLVALVAAAPSPRTRAWYGRLAIEAVVGLLAAYAVVAVATLSLSGSLPRISLVFFYARLFALAGYAMLPMPWFGFWVAIFVTFCAALTTSAIRVVRRSEDRVTTGMLAWIGIFGLGASSYYAGRSHPEVLVALFSAWSLAIGMLLVVGIRSLAAERRRVGPAELALFLGFGLAVCSLSQVPPPWRQIDRLRTHAPTRTFEATGATAFVASQTHRGEHVALLMELGQRISRNAHVTNVTPYTGVPSMPTRQQLDTTLGRLRASGGTKVFVQISEAWPEMVAALVDDGYKKVAESGPVATVLAPSTTVVMYSDR